MVGMTIQHTVVFRLTHPRGTDAEMEFLETANRVLAAITGVRDFTIQRQVSAKSDMDWQFAMTFASVEAYDAYNEHPDHVEFVQTRWAREVVAFQEYDFTARSLDA